MRLGTSTLARTVLALTGVFILGLAADAAWAAPREPGRTLVLDLPAGNVIVKLAPQDADFLLQPITGDRVPFYSPENSARIARALDEAGQFERLADVLLGTAFMRPKGGRAESGPQGQVPLDPVESTCDLVLDVRGQRVHVTMEDGPTGHLLHPRTGERYVRFSANTGSRIIEALSAAGVDRDSIARTLVGLKTKPPGSHAGPSVESHIPPQLDEGPPCGQCAVYKKLCDEICCESGGGCEWCTACS